MRTTNQESSAMHNVLPVLFPTQKPVRTKSVSLNFQRNLSELPKALYKKTREILNICQYTEKKRPSQASFISALPNQSHFEKDSIINLDGKTKDSIRISPERRGSCLDSKHYDEEQKKILYIKLKKTLDGKFINKSSGPTFNDHVTNKSELFNKIRQISNASELKSIRKSPVRLRDSQHEETISKTKADNGESSPKSLLNDCTISTIELGSMDQIDDRGLDLTMGSSSNRETSIDKSLTRRESMVSSIKKSERTSFPLIRSNSDRNLRKISLKKPAIGGYGLQVVGSQKSICLSSRPHIMENKSANAFDALDKSSTSKLNKNSIVVSGSASFAIRPLRTGNSLVEPKN